MKKKRLYLDFYMKCMETGKIPHAGLCKCLPQEFFIIFSPTVGEIVKYDHWLAYWGASYEDMDKYHGFNEFRQTMVLFLAAMNNEL